jgi:hypothetical protein
VEEKNCDCWETKARTGRGMKLATRLVGPIVMAHCVRSFHLEVGRSVVALQSRGPTSRSRNSGTWRLFSSVSATDNTKKRVVFLGTPEVAATSLRRLYEDSMKEGSPYEIVSVITQPPKRRKRKGKLEPSPVGKVAEEMGLRVLCPEKVSGVLFSPLETCVRSCLDCLSNNSLLGKRLRLS